MGYYLGLDIGTNSVGMAVTDNNYNLLRAKGKDLWCVRLFEEGKVAADRRLKRCARRRLQRRKNRIKLLNELLAEEISKVDENFYLRLKQSDLLQSDRDVKINKDKYTLFNNLDFSDKEFYKEYPTIYHLRKAIIEKSPEQKLDIRLYYIALHHILKYRGHFLSDASVQTSQPSDILKDFNELKDVLSELVSQDIFCYGGAVFEEAKDILLSNDTRSDKKKKLENLLCNNSAVENKEIIKQICALLAGSKADLKKLDEKFSEIEGQLKLSFQEDGEDKYLSAYSALDDWAVVLEKCKSIYDKVYIKRLIGEYPSLSFAMVDLYEKHKSDLKKLKDFVKKHVPELRTEIFLRTDVEGNYANYIGKSNQVKAGKSGKTKCELEVFIKYLEKILGNEKYKDNQGVQDFLVELNKEKESGKYMPKVVKADGGKFSHQIHEAELVKILEKLEQDYPSTGLPIKLRGESAEVPEMSVCERIKKLFKFRVPYYVGPLGQKIILDKYGEVKKENENNWFVPKNENEKSRITPWNFESRIDKLLTGEKFIRRMTSSCTYLYAEDTLPKNSIIFQKYLVLNFINTIKIKGINISVDLKQKLYREVYLEKKKPTSSDVLNFLKKEINQKDLQKSDISPNNAADYVVSMSSYYLFKEYFFGKEFEISAGNESLEIAEQIINVMTLFTDNNDSITFIKKLVEDEKITSISDEQIKVLRGWSFKDFGSLSRKLLLDLPIATDDGLGRELTFMDFLWTTNQNFMQILNDTRYYARNAIDEENREVFEDDDKNLIKKMNLSPSVSRSVNQAIKMVDEYVEVLGEKPDKIFVEVTREAGEKKRTLSRREQIKKFYNGDKNTKQEFKKIAEDIDFLTKNLNKKTDDELKSERLYLYFMQLGKCAYTGKNIDLEKLSTDTFDVDHILPQSLIKDDSLDNKVLVYREQNKNKTNIYPFYNLQNVITQSGKEHIDRLLKLGLMSKEKFNRITRTKPLGEDELRDFISRQIVETSWANKAVCEILKRKYYSDDVTERGYAKQKIVYSKANLVSQFRDNVGIYKCREVNNLHHAQDAYLNIVVGDIAGEILRNYDNLEVEFTGGEIRIVQTSGNEKDRRLNMERLFDKTTSKWDFKKDKERIRSIATKPSATVSRMTYIATGAFYDETIYRRGEKGITYPRKKTTALSEIDKYGGYKGAGTSFFCAYKAEDKKGKSVYCIESVPIILDNIIKNSNDTNALYEHINKSAEDRKLKNPQVIVDCIKNKSLININGSLLYLSGCNDKQIMFGNSSELFLDNDSIGFVKLLQKFVDKIKNKISYLEKDKDKNSEALQKLDDELKSDKYKMYSNRFGECKYIEKESLDRLFDLVIQKGELKCYKNLSFFKNVFGALKDKTETINTLNLYDKAVLLLNVIEYLSGSKQYCDLRLIGGAEKTGNKILSKDITELNNFEIIEKSITGLYTKKIDVLCL